MVFLSPKSNHANDLIKSFLQNLVDPDENVYKGTAENIKLLKVIE